ncbi:phosphate acyltransferase PlsX [Ruficoccus amylovorans]|uniref:Phosphate acyltransferase n=1 Tax=Ruficoccus amylovorans TaxID=1804625 RepID=A0A842H9A3_9BACT|nr:phosphate acyltransferase PlsX [Ruficoccus amylovorans]MBC2593103.1 phosphate acyltransferase PlsX [Ruficoccus amylovorans]
MVEKTCGATVAVDAMGGDLGPSEVVAAIRLGLGSPDWTKLHKIILTGRQEELLPLLREAGLENHPKVVLEHAPDVISMDEKPKAAFRRKEASLLRVIDLVRTGQADGAVSCGNTGALMFSSTLILKKMSGVERPALPAVIPSRNHHFILLDAGAQPETTSRQLVHNAILGEAYARAIFPIAKPRVGLLTIGTEEGKGTARIAEAHDLLKQLKGEINYIGLIEGFDTFRSVADVVVCDGFTGNILLKTLEACLVTLKDVLKEEITANPIRKIGALLNKGAFASIKRTFSPEHYAGAPLLGLNGLVVKAHGSSNREFIKSAVRIACDALEHDMNAHIGDTIEKANALAKSAPVTPAGVEFSG